MFVILYPQPKIVNKFQTIDYSEGTRLRTHDGHAALLTDGNGALQFQRVR